MKYSKSKRVITASKMFWSKYCNSMWFSIVVFWSTIM